jgi:hypothetical protein
MDISGYFKLNYHKLFMVISGDWCLLVDILLVAIIGYFFTGHWWLYYW